MSQYESITILGHTASGKTNLATNLAFHLKNAAIISADSRQVYKSLNIGSGKDLFEYQINDTQIPYYLIDIIDITEKYHIAQFQHDSEECYQDLINKNQIPIICGGSGMYLQSILKKYPFASVPINSRLRAILEEYSSLNELINFYESFPSNQYLADYNSKKRMIRAIEILTFLNENPDYEAKTEHKKNTLIFGLAYEREERRNRIADRLDNRLKNGLIEEVQQLLNQGIEPERLKFFGLEYKFVTEYLENILTKEEMQEKLTIAIQQFAKRQMTWFRKMEKEGFEINWLPETNSLEENVEFCIHKWNK